MISMRDRQARRRWNKACAGAMVVLFTCGIEGCGSRAPNNTPSTDDARKALEEALTAWRSGKPVGLIDTASPPIQVVDSNWWKKKRLESYEILGEEPGRDGLVCFSVRLNMSKPNKTETVRYLVNGRSPLWVYREEDYKRSQSWDGYQ
jgi:hypothetical protein